jgi:hypothetical protein
MNIIDLFKLIRNNPIIFSKPTVLQDDVEKILKTFSSLIDSINTIRNKASMAHPNENLLNEEEAILVINSIHTILHYLNDKINKVKN